MHLPARSPLAAALAAVLALAALGAPAADAAPAGTRVTHPLPALPVAPPAPRPGYRPPVRAAVLLEDFRPPAAPWGPGHRGVDLSATTGTTVVAPGGGVVVVAGTVVDRGVLTIRHPDGLRSSLEPVLPAVDVGEAVRAGQEVAVVGPDGRAGGHCGDLRAARCLHWGVRRGDRYVDPLALLGAPEPVVLLPLRG